MCSGTVITVRPMATLRDFLADSREALRQMIRDIKDGRAGHLFRHRRPGTVIMCRGSGL